MYIFVVKYNARGLYLWKMISRILIVDDEDRIRRLLRMYLEREQLHNRRSRKWR